MSEEMRHHRSAAPLARPVGMQEIASVPPGLAGPEAVVVDGASRPATQANLLAPVLRYKLTAVVTFVVAGAVFVAAVWACVAPVYSATAKLEVSPVIPQLIEGKSDMVPLYESYRSSQVDHIRGPEVMDAVLDRADVRNTAFYRNDPTTLLDKVVRRVAPDIADPPRDRLLAALAAEAPKGKNHVYVTMNTSRPGEARLIVDAVVDEYIKFTNRRESDQELDRMTKLRSEIRSREGDLSRLEATAAEHRARLKTASPETLLDQRLLRLDALIARLAELQREAEVSTGESADAGGAAADSAVADSLEADPEWRRLEHELLTARAALERAPQHLSELHPTMDRLRKSVEFAERRLKERADRILGRAGDAGSAGAASANSKLLREIEVLKRAVQSEQEQYDAAFKDAEVLRNLDADAEKLSTTLQKLRAELERIEMNREVAGTVRRWAAYEPARPTDDRRFKFSAAALAAALALGVGVAFLRGRLSPQVDRAEDVLPISAPIIGRLPLSRSGGPFVYLSDPMAAESLRLLRTTLMGSLDRVGGKVIQITSAEPGSGKSTLASELSRSVAMLNKRVLLVDADVRCPTLSERYDILDRGGLMTLLNAPQSDGGAVQDATIPTLFIMPAGECTQLREIELFANGCFSALVNRWREEFDYVVFDTPPLLASADSAILSRHMDGTLLIVRERSCRRRAVAVALESLQAAGGRVLGTVVIARRGTRGDVWLAEYPYAYGYGSRKYNDSLLA